jgi:Ca2+-binding RTX toxin-like protein
MGRFDGFRPNVLPDFPDDGTSGKDWLEWVDELLDNIFGEIPTFDDIRDFLEDNSWEDLVPDKSDVSDLITAIYDKIEDEIDPSQNIPNKVLKKIDNIDVAEGLAELMAFGYDKIDAKGRYIDPWTDKALDYADFTIVLPKSGKTKVKGTNKDDLMSGHWEAHNYKGSKGNDRIFTWYDKDILVGDKGNDHLYADGEDCTMTGGKGKDYFYLDGDATVTIKDYKKKDDMIRVDGYNKNQIKVTRKGGDSLIKAGKKTLAKVEGVKNLNKKHLEYSGGNTKTIDHDSESDVITLILPPVAKL